MYIGQCNNDWIDLNIQQNFNARTMCVHINDVSKLKIGKNIIMNRLGVLNNMIQFDWLNLSLNAFKTKVKSLFMTN